jgi:hypothetical protein
MTFADLSDGQGRMRAPGLSIKRRASQAGVTKTIAVFAATQRIAALPDAALFIDEIPRARRRALAYRLGAKQKIDETPIADDSIVRRERPLRACQSKPARPCFSLSGNCRFRVKPRQSKVAARQRILARR